MANIHSQIDKPQRGRPKRAELLYVNLNKGAQSINTERQKNIILSDQNFAGKVINPWVLQTSGYL